MAFMGKSMAKPMEKTISTLGMVISRKLCFLQTPGKNEQNQRTKNHAKNSEETRMGHRSRPNRGPEGLLEGHDAGAPRGPGPGPPADGRLESAAGRMESQGSENMRREKPNQTN